MLNYNKIFSIIAIIIVIGNNSTSLGANLNCNKIIKLALAKKLYLSPRWKALLHFDPKNKKFYIRDPNFLLSWPNPSPKKEMEETIKSFFLPTNLYKNINLHPLCRFPARKLFLERSLGLTSSVFPKIKCPDFQEYIEKAPAKKIYLIFASENIKSPPSIMGHSFIKIAGINSQGKYVEHAISFFTIIDTQNPFKLCIESLISGMNGLFSLTPYRKQIIKYLEIEKRNIWEYELFLNNYQKKLIYYHIWELKYAKIKYLFQNYNCSTLVYYLLATAKPQMIYEKPNWVAPLDVIKIAYKYGLLKKGKLLPSDQALIRILEEELTTKEILEIEKAIKTRNYNYFKKLNLKRKKDFYKLKLGEIYSYFLLKKGKINKKIWKNFEKIFIYKLEKCKYKIDLSHYKSPLKTLPKTQVSMGIKKYKNTEFLKIRFQPISHNLTDNNREYFTESSLEVLTLSLILNYKTIKIDSFKIYNVVSLIPFDVLTKGISEKFSLSINPQYKNGKKRENSFNINAGLGLTFKFCNDIWFYILGNFESGITPNRAYISLNPELGLMVYEIFNMKTFIKIQYWSSPWNYSKLNITQSIFGREKWKLSFDINYILKNKNNLNAEFLITRYF
ncbi:MAG: DUF4105 domain-containing protein [Desulfonauticus sp.]|nr:DUF4105 domain-containing protein [Desulfonauticus sp.]